MGPLKYVNTQIFKEKETMKEFEFKGLSKADNKNVSAFINRRVWGRSLSEQLRLRHLLKWN